MPAAGRTFDRLCRRLRSRRVVVIDDSMRPALEPGDRLWVDVSSAARSAPALGTIVVLADPEAPGRLLIKRVVGRNDATGRVTVHGDAAAASRDSRTFGPVPRAGILGVAWFRYRPADRRGPLPESDAVLRPKP